MLRRSLGENSIRAAPAVRLPVSEQVESHGQGEASPGVARRPPAGQPRWGRGRGVWFLASVALLPVAEGRQSPGPAGGQPPQSRRRGRAPRATRAALPAVPATGDGRGLQAAPPHRSSRGGAGAGGGPSAPCGGAPAAGTATGTAAGTAAAGAARRTRSQSRSRRRPQRPRRVAGCCHQHGTACQTWTCGFPPGRVPTGCGKGARGARPPPPALLQAPEGAAGQRAPQPGHPQRGQARPRPPPPPTALP